MSRTPHPRSTPHPKHRLARWGLSVGLALVACTSGAAVAGVAEAVPAGSCAAPVARANPHDRLTSGGVRFDVHPEKKWPNGVIPYYIDSAFNADQRNIITQAINNGWNSRVGCLKLRPYAGEKDYVYVRPGDTCRSDMGRQAGGQYLFLNVTGCVNQAEVLRQFMFAAGMGWEHSSPDRDNYIDILWDNIPEGQRYLFEQQNLSDFTFLGEFDFYSIRMLPLNVLGTNKPVYRIKRDGIDTNRIGRGKDFTSSDVDALNALYC
ncbi:M12 family metallopeptidase [Nocardia sp. NPDC050712]|uniref:M12 family metallopeptidase n=1 Tax=Nocardia sp. NPDC050712 TaxID=3155518 RepID=UPI003402332E